MIKKWKIFGTQTNLEWYDVKTKLKQLLRKLAYSLLVQELICLIILGYMWLVYLTSKKIFLNQEVLLAAAKNKSPLIISTWHNRLMMTPFAALKPKKLYSDYNFMTLASRHGDGRFVGRVMEKFGFVLIQGSSRNGRKSSRGIDVGGMKKIFSGLKKGLSLCITPDGPRGPNQKINGEIINIARVSGAGILVASCSSSRFIKLKTWDHLTIPLPFSTLCFYIDHTPIFVAKDADEKEAKNIGLILENRMNFIQDQSQIKTL